MAESDLVKELTARALAADDKVPTTLRLRRKTLKRLRAQEKRWSTSMSYIVDEAVQPALDELKAATPPGDQDPADDE